MPFKCVVPKCRGNYDADKKVSVFSFPSEEALRRKWMAAIPRDNLEVTGSSKVCQLHFHEKDIRRTKVYTDPVTGKTTSFDLSQPRLVEGAVPSIFPGCPKYLSKSSSRREDPSKKYTCSENRQLERAITESLRSEEDYNSKFCFSTVGEIRDKLCSAHLSEYWTLVQKNNELLIVHIETLPSPTITVSMTVDSSLQVTAFYRNVVLSKLGEYSLPYAVSNIHTIISLLNDLEIISTNAKTPETTETLLHVIEDLMNSVKKNIDESKQDVMTFLQEQIALLNCHKTQFRYSHQFLTFCALLFSISPHSYKFLRGSGYVIIPHPSTLKQLIAKYNLDPKCEQRDDTFLNYVKHKVRFLRDHEKHVVLLMDEIHVKSYFDFKGGSIIGIAYNCEKAASSAYVFMISSVLSSYKDVVHILPVKTMAANTLHSYIDKVIKGLEKLGFNVFCVISDNNAINKKAMSYFSNPPSRSIVYRNPVEPERPLFFIIDPVHLLKCIRNNWLNQKNHGQCMYYPSFPMDSSSGSIPFQTASMKTLRDLYELENKDLVKFAYGLTIKSLNPTNIERQNVKLALQIFNSNVAEGLLILGAEKNLAHYEGTSKYIKIISRWWDIFNVRTPYKGKHKRNVFQEPITLTEDDIKIEFMDDFINWLDAWEKANNQTGKLSKETHEALRQSVYAMIEISRYCIHELKFKYVLTGKFQTDSLEDRFGKYRQLAGANYNVTMTQIFENETKLRVQSLLSLKNFESIDMDEFSIPKADEPQFLCSPDLLVISDADILAVDHLMPVFSYIAGYCCNSALKKLNCSFCRSRLLTEKVWQSSEEYVLIKNLDRGGLHYPETDAIMAVVHNYLVISKLLSSSMEDTFLKLQNQRIVVVNFTLDVLFNKDFHLDLDGCPKIHLSENVLKLILWPSTNILLKNYCKTKNDLLVEQKGKRRKLKTLSS